MSNLPLWLDIHPVYMSNMSVTGFSYEFGAIYQRVTGKASTIDQCILNE